MPVINTDQISKPKWYSSGLLPGLRKTVWISIIIVIVIALLDLIGWIFDITFLKSIEVQWIPMKITTAICFILAGFALLIIETNYTSVLTKVVPRINAIIIILISLVTLYAYLYLISTGHESPMSSYSILAFIISNISRMAFLTALNFFLIGCILILLTSDKKNASNISHVLIIPVTIVSYFTIVSYILGAYNATNLLEVPVALNTSITFMGLCIAILLIRQDSWLVNVFISRNSGGIFARKLLPALMILPLVIGWLRIKGENAGLYQSEVGVVLVAITYTFCFLVIIWLTARSVNITDHKRRVLEEALLERSEQLSAVFNGVSETLMLLDIEGNIITANNTANNMFGNGESGIVGKNIYDVVPVQYHKRRKELVAQMILSGKPVTFKDKFGEALLELIFYPVFNTQGKVVQFISLASDITERTKNENKLLYQASMIEAVTDAVIGSDLELNINYWNKAAEKIYGWKEEEVIGKASKDIIRSEMSDEQRKAIINSISAGIPVYTELVQYTKNNKPLIVGGNSIPLKDSDGKTTGIVAINSDITQRRSSEIAIRKSEMKLKYHLENSPLAVVEWDNDFKILQWSNEAEKIFGLMREEVMGVPIDSLNIIYEDDLPLVEKTMERLSGGKELKVVSQNRNYTKERKIINCVWYYSVLLDINGKMSSVMSLVDNITPLIITQNELKENKERYEELVTNARTIIVKLDTDGNFTFINEFGLNFFGFSKEELIGKSVMDSIVPQVDSTGRDLDEMVSEITEDPDKSSVNTNENIRKNGERVWVEWHNKTSFNNKGERTGHIAIGVDVTQKRKAEKELENTKNYLENLINYANAPIIVWNTDTEIQLFNHAFEHLTGYSSAEVEGKKLDLLFPIDSLKESNEKIRNALTKNWETIEIPILKKNKEIRTVLWNSANIYDPNDKTLLSTMAQGNDITERIKAEQEVRSSKEKLDLALDSGNIGIWEWDIITDEFLWDERIGKIIGSGASASKKKLKDFEKYIYEDDIPHFRKVIQQTITNDFPFELIYRIKRKKGEICYINTKASLENSSEGIPVKMIGVCFDITMMKKETEQTLYRLNEELLRSNKELEQFAYIASHDLQEPLRMVSSFTQLLSMRYKDKLDLEAQEFIKFAVDGASRMQDLINDLLEYSRVETRGKELSIINMHDILGNVINNLSIKIQESNALITNDELPTVLVDEGQMVQLLQNLITNAIKFCNTSPRIHISAKEEKDNYLISVKDNGIGIEPQYFDRIFQIFQRLHPKEEYNGTGIGLAICKRIVERHGGKIWVESKQGEGTIFKFTLRKK